MNLFLNLNKLSQKIIYLIFFLAVALIFIGIFLLKNASYFNQINTARKLIEAGFSLFPTSILTAAIIEYLRKKTVS